MSANGSKRPHTGTSSRPPCPAKVNILLIGGGGREHALAWKIAQSPRLGKLWVTEAENPAFADLAQACPEKVDLKQIWRLTKWCDREKIDLVVVGPEGPLDAGLADALSTPTRMIFGVSKAAAQLEANKAWAKQLMRSAAIPTAESRIFSNFEQAVQYVQSREDLPVIKASGLAAGKGVILPETMDEAIEALEHMMKQHAFGHAGDTVVVEERLTGPEASVFALVDGRHIYVLETAQDHKRVFEGDRGPNTGGMGAYSPAVILDDAMLTEIEQLILVPTLDALRREEVEYRGVLYVGIILTPAGPKVLEYNCRFGDPECQVLMARMKADLVEVCWATATGRLDEVQIDWDPRPACCVVMTAPGYPGSYPKGLPIQGLQDAASGVEDVTVFHAGTCRSPEGGIQTAGGRVLGVTALGETIASARDRALKTCDKITFEGAHYRRDIAWQAEEAMPGSGTENGVSPEIC